MIWPSYRIVDYFASNVVMNRDQSSEGVFVLGDETVTDVDDAENLIENSFPFVNL